MSTRGVATAYDVNGIASAKGTVEAKGERAAQLSAQAMQVIDADLKVSPAEIAAQYAIGHKAYGYAQTPGGAVSAATTAALNPDVLQAAEGKHYRHDAQGAWTHECDAVTAHRALAATRKHHLRSLLLARAGAARSRSSTIGHCRTLDYLRRRNTSRTFPVQK